MRRLRHLFSSKSRAATPAQREDEWSIGIYFGRSLFHFESPPDGFNPVLKGADVSDVLAAYVADPFMLKVNQSWYLFFEVMNRQNRKGEIGLATSDNAIQWRYQSIVLAEAFHLSYPYVFQWNNDFYMVPESYQTNSVRLYKAVEFPKKWTFVKTLLEGTDYVDPSVFYFDRRWWMFTSLGTPPFRADFLHLFFADELLGPWFQHPKSPIIEDNAHIARPGGRVVVLHDRVVRYTQDCKPTYGSQVRAFEITDLTVESYREHLASEEPILKASGTGWNETGMHHIDPHPTDDGGWIACVDGWRWVSLRVA